MANAAALFVQLFEERQHIQGQREQPWYPEERRVNVPESTIQLLLFISMKKDPLQSCL